MVPLCAIKTHKAVASIQTLFEALGRRRQVRLQLILPGSENLTLQTSGKMSVKPTDFWARLCSWTWSKLLSDVSTPERFRTSTGSLTYSNIETFDLIFVMCGDILGALKETKT